MDTILPFSMTGIRQVRDHATGRKESCEKAREEEGREKESREKESPDDTFKALSNFCAPLGETNLEKLKRCCL